MMKLHFCQRTWLPSTSKLGPSGWVISSGLISPRNLFTLRLFVDRHGRLHARYGAPVEQLAVGQRERGLVASVGGIIEQDGESRARQESFAGEFVYTLFVRLLERDRDKTHGRRDLPR